LNKRKKKSRRSRKKEKLRRKRVENKIKMEKGGKLNNFFFFILFTLC
jgi:hypothetical protein